MRLKMCATLAASAIIAIGAPALAAPPWTVTVGAQPSGQVPFSGYTKSAFNSTVVNGANVAPMSCGAAAAAGVVYPGSYPTGIKVGEVQGTGWANCVGPGLSFNMYQPQNSKWHLNLTGPAGPPWAGYLSSVSIRVESKPAGVCSYNVTGRINLSLDTAQAAGNNAYTQTLTIQQPDSSSNLTVSGVSGCLGIYANGNRMGLQGGFKIYNSVGLVGVS